MTMRFSEISLFGVYIPPILPLMLLAWLALLPLRRAADAYGLLRWAWHPALFLAAVYVILLALLVLAASAGLF